MNKHIKTVREALGRYADPENWGYYDESGCDKGHGQYTDACFIGLSPARDALADLVQLEAEVEKLVEAAKSLPYLPENLIDALKPFEKEDK